MSTCNSHTLSGLGVTCDASMGGIAEVYIAHKSDIGDIKITEDKISAITLNDSAKFKTYSFRKGTGSMTQTWSIDAANGVYFCQTDLSLAFSRMDTQKRVEMQTLVLDDVVVIVRDCNNVYWYLGYNEPVNASAAGAETGTARTDGNKYTLTLTDYSLEYPYEVDASIIAGIVE